MLARSLTAVLGLLVTPAWSAVQTLTVDDDKPADFSSIADAIAAAAPGDVLLVMEGEYDAFVLDKPLSILGPAGGERPHVSGASRVQGVGGFDLAGLNFDRLEVDAVVGRGQLDDCQVGGPLASTHSLAIVDCDELLIERCSIGPEVLTGVWGGNNMALRIQNSRVALVDSAVRGANGKSGFDYGDGQGALEVQHSQVWVSGTDLRAGSGGADGFCVSCGGDGGDGLVVVQSTVVLRGFSNQLSNGLAGSFGADDGHDLVLSGATVVYGAGAGINGFSSILELGGGNALVQVPAPEPFLTIAGGDAPGEARRLLLRGPDGAHAFVATSLSTGFLESPGFEGAVWLSPDALLQVLPLLTEGNDDPVTYEWVLPPSFQLLHGLSLHVQAVFPGVLGTALNPGAMQLTNPASLIVRHELLVDCNENAVPDEVDIALGTSQDCNQNGIPDECDIEAGSESDCNQNGIPDACDIAFQTSTDANANGIPDECLEEGDCNQNGVSDILDILLGASADCDADFLPDECEVATNVQLVQLGLSPLGESQDHYADFYDVPPTVGDVTVKALAIGDLEDGLNERIDVMLRTSPIGLTFVGRWFDEVGEASACPLVPDSDQFVLDASTWNDALEVTGSWAQFRLTPSLFVSSSECPGSYVDLIVSYVSSQDCNGNDVPDSCDIASGFSFDLNADGIPDECQP